MGEWEEERAEVTGKPESGGIQHGGDRGREERRCGRREVMGTE